MTGRRTQRVVESLHSRDATYCVDVIQVAEAFSLQICRRDEGRWQVIKRQGEYQAREDAVAGARELIATF